MDGDSSVADWLAQLKTGMPGQAQQDIWGRYFGRLVALARTKLRDTPAAWHDEEDVALSAMKSFFIRARGPISRSSGLVQSVAVVGHHHHA